MQVADARLRHPDFGAGVVDMACELSGDAGDDRIQGNDQREGEGDAADRGHEADAEAQ